MPRKLKASAIEPPPMPAPTDEEIRLKEAMIADMRDLAAQLLQRNLDIAVLLAQQAARQRGPLVEHFAELGRRYRSALNAPEKPRLRVVKGGVS